MNADGGSGERDGGPSDADGGLTGDGGPRDQGTDEPTPRVRGGACSAGGPPSGGLLTHALLSLLMLMLRRRGVGAGLMLLVSLGSAPAEAQRLEPDAPTAPDDRAMIERAAPELARLRPALRVGAGYVDDPLVAIVGDEERALVGERFRLSLAASLAFLERAHLALRVGLVAQDGLGAAGVDEAQPDLATVALAAPAIDGRVVLLGREAPVELALAATLRLPVGTGDAFVRDSGASVWPRVLLARQLDGRGSFVALSLGVDVRPRATLGDLTIDSLWTFGLGGAVAIGQRSAITLELSGATVFARAFDGPHSPLRATAGLRWRSDALSVHLWGGVGLSPGFGTPDALFGLSLGWRLPVADLADA